ncbi:MAG: histidinol-phosphatase [Helicobacteraceae bacterium]|jgi:histidinol-phosphatase (PHP family)|nr:histidinol-phosphatase [Helicobacteraceae bacterium]
MKIDLHNHTTLCNHATGSVDAYVEAAIANGTDVFGFSDHAPMDFDPGYRMRFDEMTIYQKWVMDAKTKYADKIDVLFGYEVDYLPGHMDERVLNADVDFLIGSVHFINGWGFDNPEFIGRYEHEDIDVIWQNYFDLIEAMAKSGYFDIVGHIDLIKVFKFMPIKNILEMAMPALKAIKAADMVLEINVAGYRKPCQEPYPSPSILKAAFDLGIPITFGSDAHNPEQIGLFREEVERLAKSIGYTECAYFTKRQRTLVKF